jgi:hypothetical protein
MSYLIFIDLWPAYLLHLYIKNNSLMQTCYSIMQRTG